jgi:N-acetylneuraminic acid mutarotase/tRNA A-37 threonylcarbamoyl transferase component Bud32
MLCRVHSDISIPIYGWWLAYNGPTCHGRILGEEQGKDHVEDLVGRSLGGGRYRLLSVLGRGGMATVYEAEHTGLHRRVAIKVLDPALTHRPDFVGRFQREAETIAQLEHPHILPVYDTGEDDGLLYLVMFLVRDGTLKSQLRGGQPAPWPPRRVLQLSQQILPALDTAHREGIVHRDIKPDNILLHGDRAFLSDFGIAKLLQGDPGLTVIGTFVGTPEYAAPEQVLALPLDGRSDLYAFGVVLYELLVGHVPYRGETPMGVALQHVQASLPPPREANPALPEPIARVLVSALAKERDRRYPSGAALVAALEDAVREGEANLARTEPGQPEAISPTRAAASGQSSYPGVLPPDMERLELELAREAEAEAEARRRAEEAEARRRADEEETRRRAADEQARRVAEAEALRKAAEEAEARRLAAEEEARRKAAEEAEARRVAAEEEARRKAAEDEARRKAAEEAEAHRKAAAEAEARRRAAEEESRRQAAADEARRKAEAEARRKAAAEAEARREPAAAVPGPVSGRATREPRAIPAGVLAESGTPRWPFILGGIVVLLLILFLLGRAVFGGPLAATSEEAIVAPTIGVAAAPTNALAAQVITPTAPTPVPTSVPAASAATATAPAKPTAAPSPTAAPAATQPAPTQAPTQAATQAPTQNPAGAAPAPLQLARYAFTTSLLGNGKLLVMGGRQGADATADASIYDPIANTWSPAGQLATPRAKETSTILSDGRVLVVGGQKDDATFLSTAEIYDPASNNWTSAGSLQAARADHTATLLKDGRVLIVGGTDGREFLSSTEIYDPVAHSWSAASPMPNSRSQHTATLLDDGRVLVLGGFGAETSAVLWDPGKDAWSAVAAMPSGRLRHTATLLQDGKVLVLGGSSSIAGTLSSADVYDPASDSWAQAGQMASPRSGHTATLLPGGQVLVIGGNSGSAILASVEGYDPAGSRWVTAAPMSVARWQHTATLLPAGQVLVIGGSDGSAALNSLERYNLATNTWTSSPH